MNVTAERTPMTVKQKAIYDWIVERNLSGNPVGVRDVATEFEFGANAASGHIVALRKKGYLSQRAGSKGRANDLRPAVHELRIAKCDDAIEIRTTGPVKIEVEKLTRTVREAWAKQAA